MRPVAIIFGVGLGAFVGLQFIRPAISNPPVTADLAAPAEVKQIFKTSCYDCHSNETRLAWFDRVVPVYWKVASDVKEARRHLNFSEIGKLPPAQQRGILYEAVNQIQAGAMPLSDYLRLHRDAVVTPAELTVLKSYLSPPAEAATLTEKDYPEDDAQYQKWTHEGTPARSVAPSPNGIEFLSDYKNWKAINTTDRFDNQTLRVILGNDVATKAIAENHVNPWPDGTAFAKVAWAARDDGHGQLRSGAFLQVEFMIRDSRKYAATKNWGFARWRGTDLTPYGQDAGFAAECVGCHTPVRASDYVFTRPLRAPLAGTLPLNPLQWNVITSSVDHQASTMSTLYRAGSVLAMVTWTQQEDDRWFGARIPGPPKSVEFVTVTAGPNYSYEDYQGSPLQKTSSQAGRKVRLDDLLSRRAAVMP